MRVHTSRRHERGSGERKEKPLSKEDETSASREAAVRIEAFVQKRVRQELESEAFLLALEKKIEDAKKSLTDKLLATVEKEVITSFEREQWEP